MKKVTVLIIVVVLAASVLLVYLSLYFASLQKQPQLPRQPPPLEQVVSASGKKYVIKEPLSWSDVFLLVLRDQASYRHLMPYSDPYDKFILGEMYIAYVVNGSGCQGILDWCSKRWGCGFYDFLLKDNCALLEMLMFSTEKSWYPTIALVNKLADRVPVSGNYSLWALVYWENGSMVVEFFNVADPAEDAELSARIKSLAEKYPAFMLVTLGEKSWWWYDEYRTLTSSGVPFALLLQMTENAPYVPQLERELDSSYGASIYTVAGILYKNGEIYALWAPLGFRCEYFTIEHCSESLQEVLKYATSG